MMRRLVLGVDASGRSCIAESGVVASRPIQGLPGTTIANLFSTDESPPPPVVKGLGRHRPGVLPPGHVDWYVINHEARSGEREPAPHRDMHSRDVVDLLLIVEGSAQLVLGDGAHRVGEGDCIVMAGTEHAFQPDAGGCLLIGFAIGAQAASN